MPTMPPNAFVPQALDATDFAAVEPLLKSLLTRPVSTRQELEQWLIDRGELSAACGEAKANLYISMTCDTEDAAVAKEFERFITDVEPKLKPYAFELDKRLVELARVIPLPQERYEVILRDVRTDVALFRSENIPLETELGQLGQKFEQLAGSLSVTFDGREQTMPQMARYQERTDRALRESAWRCTAERRLKEVDAFNDIYDRMIALRHQIARNAGHETFAHFIFPSKHRFDYTPKDCFDFHAGVEKAVVPVMRQLDWLTSQKLGVTPLRPWDLAVDAKGRAPLAPFSDGKDLMAKSVACVQSLDPRLGTMLRELGDGSEARGSRDGACLDLDSRKGKAPGGYQYMRSRSRTPFIFMNAAGLHKDAVIMLHEAGHAFHSMLCREEPLLEYRGTTEEFAEVASMSMELLSMPHWSAKGSFYEGKPEDFRRACRDQLKRVITVLPWVATIDAFQHWVYTNPTHTRRDREQHWLTLDARFGNAISWEGIEHIRPHVWQRQIHLFSYPFYYIEYGIAQLGALQLWLMALERGESTAIDHYIRALSLGGCKPLPKLFDAAGIKFDFSAGTIQRLMDRVSKELERLPE